MCFLVVDINNVYLYVFEKIEIIVCMLIEIIISVLFVVLKSVVFYFFVLKGVKGLYVFLLF